MQNFGQKQHSESIQTAKWQAWWLWRFLRIRHLLNRFKSSQMKIDTIQNLMNWFNQSQKVFMIRFNIIWIDSCDTIQKNCESIHCDTIQENYELIHCDAIHENLTWFKRSDTRKMDKKNAWYESMNHESNQAIHGRIFLYMTTHKTSRNHMEQWGLISRYFNIVLS